MQYEEDVVARPVEGVVMGEQDQVLWTPEPEKEEVFSKENSSEFFLGKKTSFISFLFKAAVFVVFLPLVIVAVLFLMVIFILSLFFGRSKKTFQWNLKRRVNSFKI